MIRSYVFEVPLISNVMQLESSGSILAILVRLHALFVVYCFCTNIAFATLGQWDANGNLRIVDRKKDLVKLSHGEYIALGKLESVYRSSPFVETVLVYGDAKVGFHIVLCYFLLSVSPFMFCGGLAFDARSAGCSQSQTPDRSSSWPRHYRTSPVRVRC